jgi:hypothetical protein
MSRSSSAQEVERQYLEGMSPDLGPFFYGLWNECALLHWKWGEYRILFGTKPERVDILIAAAGTFFRLVQDTLWENILLHIARLVDPPKTKGKSNLTLRRLPGLVDPAIRAQTEQLLQCCRDKAQFAVDSRHRRLAHCDLDLALQQGAQPLAPASRASVQEAIDAIAALLNSVDLHYRNQTVAYGALPPIGNAESLLYVLMDGLAAEDRRRERLLSGNLAPEESNPPQEI